MIDSEIYRTRVKGIGDTVRHSQVYIYIGR
jgi:hypothetical protein